MRFLTISLVIFSIILAAGVQAADQPVSLEDMKGVTEIVFAERKFSDDGHWYANISYKSYAPDNKNYRDGGKLCKLNLKTNQVTTLIDDPKGGVRDPQVNYDGKRIIFSWRRDGSEYYNLYQINADGSGLKQITSGPYDDIEPVYTADGSIVFVSTRCNRFVNCWVTRVAIIHKCDADGKNIHPLSCNGEQDNTPWPLPDGRLLYMRWEYTDRSQVDYHHLWTMNPDGTGQTVYYGNLHPSTVMIDAKPIPGSDNIVSLFSPGHGAKEHEGFVTIVNPKQGPDFVPSARRVCDRTVRDPWAFSEKLFMAASGQSIVAIDGSGKIQNLYTLPEEDKRAGFQVNEPRPICVRPKEHLIKAKTNPKSATGTFMLADVYSGRNMAGVKRGEIKKLLVLELLPKPINYTGGQDPLTFGGTFTLERVLGTVPVEEDGSAYFEAPALRSVFFVALDENDMSVKRMQSFTSVMPGENYGCFGCHENREKTFINNTSKPMLAMRRPASVIQAIKDVPDVLDFPRDIQPILTKHCAGCHNPDKRSGGVDLAGGRGPMYSISYYTLTVRNQFSDGRNRAKSNLTPRSIGSSASPLLRKMSGKHHDLQVSPLEFKTVRLWIETGAAYPGTYAALGTGCIGLFIENNPANRFDLEWESTKLAGQSIEKRCVSCHTDRKSLPRVLSDGNDKRHLYFNLTQPEKSLMVMAPLAKEAGGSELCKDKDGKPIFTSTTDPDYKQILAMISQGKTKLDEIKRFDMPGFIPRPDYIRELTKYGLIDKTYKPGDAIDYYAMDQKYWRSFWYQPE